VMKQASWGEKEGRGARGSKRKMRYHSTRGRKTNRRRPSLAKEGEVCRRENSSSNMCDRLTLASRKKKRLGSSWTCRSGRAGERFNNTPRRWVEMPWKKRDRVKGKQKYFSVKNLLEKEVKKQKSLPDERCRKRRA